MNATLETITPVHIGNGITLNRNIDFIQSGDKIGIIDEKKVFGIIGKENIHHWVNAIEKGNNEVILLLKQRGWNGKSLDEICSRIEVIDDVDTRSNRLKEIYRTSLKGITIPGSSIKGAIRTAIFDSLITDDVLKAIGIADLKNKRGKFSYDSLDKKLLGSNANEKSTRFLKVGDAHFENISAHVYEVQILNAYRNNWGFKDGQQILIEAIPAGVKANLRAFIDTNLLKENIRMEKKKWPDKRIEFLGSIEILCELVNTFTKSLVRFDHDNLIDEDLDAAEKLLDIYKHVYDVCKNAGEREMILRVGGNSGYLFTTGQWIGMENCLNITDNEFSQIRRSVQKRNYDNMTFWPKTRKTTVNGDLFGFVRIIFD